jgi:hypothetical protein
MIGGSTAWVSQAASKRRCGLSTTARHPASCSAISQTRATARRTTVAYAAASSEHRHQDDEHRYYLRSKIDYVLKNGGSTFYAPCATKSFFFSECFI